MQGEDINYSLGVTVMLLHLKLLCAWLAGEEPGLVMACRSRAHLPKAAAGSGISSAVGMLTGESGDVYYHETF